MKHILKLQDGRIEPIKDLMKSEKEFTLRRVLVDGERGGAKNLTFGYAKFDARTSYHKKHIHPHAEEIFYILSGKGIGGVGEGAEEVEIVKGDTASGFPEGQSIGCTIPLILRARFSSFMLLRPWNPRVTRSLSDSGKRLQVLII